jgi:hemoglobin
VSDPIPLFEAVGGLPFFEQLVDRFYDKVASDPPVVRLPTARGSGTGSQRLALFLGEYWGGPPAYSAERGT